MRQWESLPARPTPRQVKVTKRSGERWVLVDQAHPERCCNSFSLATHTKNLVYAAKRVMDRVGRHVQHTCYLGLRLAVSEHAEDIKGPFGQASRAGRTGGIKHGHGPIVRPPAPKTKMVRGLLRHQPLPPLSFT